MTEPATAQRGESFPSTTDLQSLRQAWKDANFQWAGLTNAQRWHYHAYNYAYLRIRHGLQSQSYPLDPDGKWFHAELAEAAERIYSPRPAPYAARIRPADTQRDPDLAALFERQDAERDALKFQVQVHGERREDGSYTPEMKAFMDCCLRQATANEKAFSGRTRRAFSPEGRMSSQEIQQIHKALGASATERKMPKHEDPDELRKARTELGLAAD